MSRTATDLMVKEIQAPSLCGTIPIAVVEANTRRRIFALAKVTAAISLRNLADYEKRQVPRAMTRDFRPRSANGVAPRRCSLRSRDKSRR